jgi:hypothetical protein
MSARPGFVMVEHPIGEAEALVADVRSGGASSLGGQAIERLERAIAVERGPGGAAALRPAQGSENALCEAQGEAA